MKRKTLTSEEARKLIGKVIDNFAIDGDDFDAVLKREMVRDRMRDKEWLAEELAGLDEPTTSEPSSRTGLAGTGNVIHVDFGGKRAAQTWQCDASYQSLYDERRRTGTRSAETEADEGWFINPEASLAPVARAGSTHVISLQWFASKIPDVPAILLFLDGKSCDVSDKRQSGRNLKVYVDLVELAGTAIPLDRFESCLEDNSAVRIQLWTKNTT